MHKYNRLALLALALFSLLSFPSRQPAADAAMGVRWGYYTGYDKATSFPSLQAHAQDLNYVSPYFGYQVEASGSLSGKDDPEVTRTAQAAGAKVLPLVQNRARYAEFTKLIADPAMRSQIIGAIVNMVVANGYQGVNIDFEGVSDTDRPHMTAFMAELYPQLRARRKLVTMAVPAKARDATTGWAGSYDYSALAPHADLFIIMAYDYSYPAGKPGPVAPVEWVRGVTEYARSTLGAHKTVVSLALYGYDWNTTAGGKATSTRYPQIAELRKTYGATLGYDRATQSATATYVRDGQQHQVWYEDARSLDAKLAVVRQAGVAGVALWRLGQEDPRIWNSIRGLSVGVSSPSFSPNADRYEDAVAVSYRTEVPATVKLEVLDAAGRAVRTLQPPAELTPGSRSVRWDGRDDAGARLPDGAYTARVTATVGGSPVTDSAPVALNTALGRLSVSHATYAPGGSPLSASYSLSVAAHVSATVRQGSHVVRTLLPRTAQGSGSYAVVWDGLDASGSTATEGGYSIWVVADSAAGQSALVSNFYVDSRAPEVTNPRVASPRYHVNGATTQAWSYNLGEAATVELRLSRGGKLVRVFKAAQTPGRRAFRWSGYEGASLAPAGTYAYSIVATDAAGNKSAPVTGTFTVSR